MNAYGRTLLPHTVLFLYIIYSISTGRGDPRILGDVDNLIKDFNRFFKINLGLCICNFFQIFWVGGEVEANVSWGLANKIEIVKERTDFRRAQDFLLDLISPRGR